MLISKANPTKWNAVSALRHLSGRAQWMPRAGCGAVRSHDCKAFIVNLMHAGADNVKEGVEAHFVDTYQDVFKLALGDDAPLAAAAA